MISVRNTLSTDLWGSPITRKHQKGNTLSVTNMIRKTSDQFYAETEENKDPLWFKLADWI